MLLLSSPAILEYSPFAVLTRQRT